MNVTDEIERLAALRRDGHLTDDEFAQAKAKALSSMATDIPADVKGSDRKGVAGRFGRRWVVAAGAAALVVAASGTAFAIHGHTSSSSARSKFDAATCDAKANDLLAKENSATALPAVRAMGCGWRLDQLATQSNSGGDSPDGSAEGGQDTATADPSAPATTDAVPLDTAMARARAVIPELQSAPDDAVQTITGAMCVGLQTGKSATDVLAIAEKAGLDQRASVGLLDVAVVSICPANADQVSSELEAAHVSISTG